MSDLRSDASAEGSKAIAQRFYNEIFNHQNLELLEQFLAPDFVWNAPYDPTALHGIESTKAFLNTLFQAFPDYHVTIEDLFSEQEQVAIRWVATGTHKGAFKGYAATQQEVVIPGISMMKLRHGKLVKYWSMLDNFLVLAQMGAFEKATV